MASMEIRLKRASKVYKEGDVVAGVIAIQSKSDLSHQGITLEMDGQVSLQLSAKSVGVFEAFYNSLKPIQLVSCSAEIAKHGKLPAGITEIPFEFPLKPNPNRTLYETYHGVFVNIQYMLKADMKRSFLNKDLQKQCEFVVEYKPGESKASNPMKFTINPTTIANVKEKQGIPDFNVTGTIDSVTCCITQPFSGVLRVENSSSQIKSIELQLVRVETCGCAEGYAKDATEIQNIQLADGDVCRGFDLPIYMIFPRLFTCPTLTTNNFKVEFEVNVVVVFYDDHLVTENIPLHLTRF